MWKSLFVTRGDLIAFMDADLLDWDTHFVPGLLGPLLSSPDVQLVKGFYQRPFTTEAGSAPFEGGRVTELVARPADRAALPRAARPGAAAGRRVGDPSLALRVALGADGVRRRAGRPRRHRSRTHGLDAIAQVDLGTRAHRHQALRDLGGMSAQILAAALGRAGARANADGVDLRQFVGSGAELEALDRFVPTSERPPARDL